MMTKVLMSGMINQRIPLEKYLRSSPGTSWPGCLPHLSWHNISINRWSSDYRDHHHEPYHGRRVDKILYQRSLNLIKVFATVAMATQRLKLKIRSSSTLFRSWNLLIIPLSCILAACNIQSVPINLHSVSCLIILWIVFCTLSTPTLHQ